MGLSWTPLGLPLGLWGVQMVTALSCWWSQLGGCGILGVGVWLATTQGSFATLSSSFPSLSAANLLIVTGTFVMAIGFVGCIGAIKENKCLLLTVSVGGTPGWGRQGGSISGADSEVFLPACAGSSPGAAPGGLGWGLLGQVGAVRVGASA